MSKTLPPRGDRRALGDYGEGLACEYLRGLGFEILARNVRVGRVELDAVAREGRTLCFVEVRTRRSARFGRPEESIDRRKQIRLVRAALGALREHRWPAHEALRFDVVAVDASTDPPEIRLIRDAFYFDRT